MVCAAWKVGHNNVGLVILLREIYVPEWKSIKEVVWYDLIWYVGILVVFVLYVVFVFAGAVATL